MDAQAGVESPGSMVDYLSLETADERGERMAWWREARFGMFIHWGLYAIPAGQWKDRTDHAEWILQTGEIPVNEYEKFASQFNPVKFDAAEWVRMAKDAGMKYIVITSKHHDGFCLWDSKLTDYDVMDATAFKRDILKELTEACNREGIRMCFYHSIMDWHHPDYLPRRSWETRSAEGADLDRYVRHMKGQLAELVQNYQPEVLWFDGEWENTWNHERGVDLYNYVRALKPDIIINNRVDPRRSETYKLDAEKELAGDFGTPEQRIPATGLKGYDWETCMTMNDHWGWNKFDKNFKSSRDLIRKLIDIASKGGNFLLNIGPKADGTFPQESIDRLRDIGRWMKVNGSSIYGTSASLFESLPWGRSTTKGNRIYLHIFDWPQEGKLSVPGLLTPVKKAYLPARPQEKVSVESRDNQVLVNLPVQPIDSMASVVVLEFETEPEVVNPPHILGDEAFYPEGTVELVSNIHDNIHIHYTLDGSTPTSQSKYYTKPLLLSNTTTVTCQVYRAGKAISAAESRTFTLATPREALKKSGLEPGLRFKYFHGQWSKLPDYNTLTPQSTGTTDNFDISGRTRREDFGFSFIGYLNVPTNGMYRFYLLSDDGSKLYLHDEPVVDNDGEHSRKEKEGAIALEAGVHPIRAEFFQRGGEFIFEVSWSGPGIDKQPIPAGVLSHEP
ncbi:MAG: alpha-L-fucosidase [Sedimentisphaerales bacterium]|nr:alpha-L-fucosidase [Sedimentisphaerales bacterium]